jgi:hypothetical protein
VADDDVQVKFYTSPAVKALIDQAVEKDPRARNMTAWLNNAVIDKLAEQGFTVGGEKKKETKGRK